MTIKREISIDANNGRPWNVDNEAFHVCWYCSRLESKVGNWLNPPPPPTHARTHARLITDQELWTWQQICWSPNSANASCCWYRSQWRCLLLLLCMNLSVSLRALLDGGAADMIIQARRRIRLRANVFFRKGSGAVVATSLADNHWTLNWMDPYILANLYFWSCSPKTTYRV